MQGTFRFSALQEFIPVHGEFIIIHARALLSPMFSQIPELLHLGFL